MITDIVDGDSTTGISADTLGDHGEPEGSNSVRHRHNDLRL
jgi:hypothetical protein